MIWMCKILEIFLVAGIAASHRNAHSTFDSCRMRKNWYTGRIMPTSWSWKNCAIGWGTFSKWCITFTVRMRFVTLSLITFVGTAFRPVADEKWASFFHSHRIIKNGANRWFWTNYTLCTRLHLTRWPLQLWTFRENLPHLTNIMENSPNLRHKIFQ